MIHRVLVRRMPNWLLLVGLAVTSGSASGQVQSGADGRLIRWDDRDLVLVGDSGTQCVMQNLNINYHKWIDDCAEAGLNAIHIWSFMAPRQTKTGKIREQRYGYVYPGVTPWKRHRGGPLARDGLPRWDLREFDEGDDPERHYWARLRDLCRYARRKQLLVGITVFFGWPKHQSDWAYHPLNVSNGGHLSDNGPIIKAVQQIAQPKVEVLRQRWSDSWTDAKKTQWVWERFAAKLLKETWAFGNTFYVFMDERSYSEGNCGDHFAEFFRQRNVFWIDGQLRRERVDGVVDGHGPGRDINRAASQSLERRPPRPFFEFELPPYHGAEVRHNLYACLLGGGHYFFHNDAEQETPTTGIMVYDPHVKNGRRDAVRQRLRWLGIACRIMNANLTCRARMVPKNKVVSDGAGYCLAAPGSEYVVYVKSGGVVTVRLDCDADLYDVTLISPRTGKQHDARVTVQSEKVHIILPDKADWVVLLRRRD